MYQYPHINQLGWRDYFDRLHKSLAAANSWYTKGQRGWQIKRTYQSIKRWNRVNP